LQPPDPDAGQGDLAEWGNSRLYKIAHPQSFGAVRHGSRRGSGPQGRRACWRPTRMRALRVSDFAQTAAIQAGIVLPSSTEPQAAVATPKNKKAQKSARGQNHSRDQDRYGALSRREVRVDDWAARGYAPRPTR